MTSGTAFTLTLSAADRAGLDPLINQNGTTSTGATVYNLAGAEDWATGAAAGVSVADPTTGVTVSNINQSPALTINAGIGVDEAGVVTVANTRLAASDPDDSGSGLIFTLTSAPTRGRIWIDGNASGAIDGGETALAAGGTFTQADLDQGVVRYLHDGSETTTDSLGFNLADGGENGSASISGQTLAITVHPVNDAPVAGGAVASQTGREGTPFSLGLNAGLFTDADVGNSLTYTATLGNGSALPPWLAFEATNRRFSGTPGSNDSGLHTVRVTATDQSGASASVAFTLGIADVPAPPPAPPPVVAPTPPPPPPPVATGSGEAPVVTFNQGNDNLSGLSRGPVAPVVTFTNSGPPPTTTPVPAPTPFSTTTTEPFTSPSAQTPFSPPPVAPVVPTAPIAPTAPAPTPAVPTAPAPEPATPTAPARPATPATPSSPPSAGGFQVTAAPSGANVGQSGLSLAGGIPDVVSSGAGGAVDFAVPSTAFSHSDGNAVVQLAAQQADGAALPAWLKFDPATGKFSGAPPPGSSGNIAIKVVARDSAGKEAVAVFSIKVGADATTPRPGANDQGAGLFDPHGPWMKLARGLAADHATQDQDAHPVRGKPSLSHQFARHGREGVLVRGLTLAQAAEKLAVRRARV